MGTSRKKHSSSFKARVAIEALKERESLSELSQRFEVSQSQISKWKSAFLEQSHSVFESGTTATTPSEDKTELYAKIGQLEMENDFLKKNLKKLGL